MKDALFGKKYNVNTVRLEGYDYGTDGAYFITVCSYDRRQIFSEIFNGEIHLLPVGKIIEEEILATLKKRDYVTIPEWIIMPDHIHLIIFIHKDSNEPEHLPARGHDLYFPEKYKNRFGPQKDNIASIVRGIKSAVTTRAKIERLETKVWQDLFHEHIIRNQRELENHIQYTRNNPLKWAG